MFEPVDKEIVVSSVVIGDTAVEIGFFEKRDQAQRAGLMKTLVLDRTRFPEIINEIVELVDDLIDAGLLEIRSPEETLDPRKRIAKRATDDEET